MTAGTCSRSCVAVAGCASTLSGSSMATTTPNGTSEQIPVEIVRSRMARDRFPPS